MKTSLHDLQFALGQLVGSYRDGSGQITGLASAARSAKHLSERFDGVNTTLKEGLENLANFMNKIDSAFYDILKGVYDDIYNFTEESYQLELSARLAVNKANEASENILNELGIE